MTRWYPDLAEQALNCLHERTRPSLTLFVESAGYLPDWDVALMQTAYCVEPRCLSPALLMDRVPYARPESFVERLSAAVRHGWLQEDHGNFYLTNGGREVVEGIYDLSDRLCAKIVALTTPEMEYLLSLCERIIDHIKELPEPPAKPAFELSLSFERDDSTPLIVKICQRIVVLLAFRDDVHISAWLPYESGGHIWEAFTLIWRGQVGNAADLARQLSHRNFAESDYAIALEELSARNWITYHRGKYIIQTHAARMRQQVECATDRAFAIAFNGLSLVEMEKFRDLMGKFTEAVCA